MRLPNLSALIAMGALAAATPALAQKADPGVKGPPSATVVISAKSAAVGVGYSWGDGVLDFHHHEYHFSVNGISIAAVGFSEVTGHGRVYNLKQLSDFSGTYVAATGEATLGKGIGGQYLRNDHGVVLRIDDVTKGARLAGSADGIKLTLKP